MRRILSCVILLHLLNGCVFLRDYPEHWPERVVGEGSCDQLAGSFANIGAIHPADSNSLTLDQLVLDLKASRKGVDRVTLDFADDRILVVRAFQGERLVDELRYSESHGTLRCGPDGAKVRRKAGLSSGRGNPLVGFENISTTITKAEDGSLILKISSSGFGLVYLLFPAGYAEHHWYRFRPFPLNQP